MLTLEHVFSEDILVVVEITCEIEGAKNDNSLLHNLAEHPTTLHKIELRKHLTRIWSKKLKNNADDLRNWHIQQTASHFDSSINTGIKTITNKNIAIQIKNKN